MSILDRLRPSPTHKTSSVGLHLLPNGLWVAGIHRGKGTITLTFCAFLPGNTPEERLEALKRCVKEKKLAHLPTVCVLNPDVYQLIQMPVPQGVPVAERIPTLRWQVKDIIRFPAKEAILDTFPQPSGKLTEGPEKLNLVAIPPHVLEMVDHLIKPSRLSLTAVDIGELSLRNVAARHADAPQGLALLHLFEDSGSLLFIHGETLSFSSRSNIGRRALEAESHAMETLAFDVQRAVDHIHRFFSEQPLPRLFLSVSLNKTLADRLHQQLSQHLDLTVEPFPIDTLFRSTPNTDQTTESTAPSSHAALPAIGAALRDIEPQP